MRLGEGATIRVSVPLHVKGTESSPGIKRGGTVNIVAHTIDLQASVENIPQYIEVDVAGLEINRLAASVGRDAARRHEGGVASRCDAGDDRAAVGLRRRAEGCCCRCRRACGRRCCRSRGWCCRCACGRCRRCGSRRRRCQGSGRRRPEEVSRSAGARHASLRWARQSGCEVPGSPAQHRLCRRRRDRAASRICSVAPPLSGRDRRGHAGARARDPAQAHDLHERLRSVGRRGGELLQAGLERHRRVSRRDSIFRPRSCG